MPGQEDGKPEVDVAEWRLAVTGMVERPAWIDWLGLCGLPTRRSLLAEHAAAVWPLPASSWEGVPTAEFARLAGALPDASHVVARSLDGTQAVIALADFLEPGSVVAHTWEDAPLRPVHGAPARLVLAGGTGGCLWLCGIEFVA